MSIEPIDSMDAELMPTKAEANASVERAIDHAEGFWSEIQWQAEHKAWESLGYASFDELWERRYSSLGVRISREERPELVAALRGIGQTQQGIADKLGVNHATVSRDLANANSGSSELRSQPTNVDSPATITNSRGQERPASYAPRGVDPDTGEILDEAPAPANPRRRPITDAFFEATYDLGKLVERIERLTEDDRFSRNKNEIAQSRKSDLVRAADTLDSILRQLD